MRPWLTATDAEGTKFADYDPSGVCSCVALPKEGKNSPFWEHTVQPLVQKTPTDIHVFGDV